MFSLTVLFTLLSTINSIFTIISEQNAYYKDNESFKHKQINEISRFYALERKTTQSAMHR